MTKRSFPTTVSQAELDAAQYFQDCIKVIWDDKGLTEENEMLISSGRVELPANVAHIFDAKAPKWVGMYRDSLSDEVTSKLLVLLDKIRNHVSTAREMNIGTGASLHRKQSFGMVLREIKKDDATKEHHRFKRLCTLFRLAGTPQHHPAKSYIVRFDEAMATVEKLEMRMSPSAQTRKIFSTFSTGSMIGTARHDDDNRLLFVLNMFNHAEKMMKEANAEINAWLHPKEATGRYMKYQHGDPAAMILMNRIRMEFMETAGRTEETLRSFEHIRAFARYHDVSPVRIWEKVISASDTALRRHQINTIVQAMMELEHRHVCEVFLNDFTNFMEFWTKIMWKSSYYYPFDSMELIFERFEDEPTPA